MTADDFKNAINLLDATLLDTDSYAYRDDATRRYYIVDAEDMANLEERIAEGERDAYSLWCAATDAKEMPEGWTPEGAEEGKPYTYTVYDSDPNEGSATAWGTHTKVEVEVDNDAEARDAVLEALGEAACECCTEDGYCVGDTLYAILWAPDGTVVETLTYDLTAADLGIEEDEEDDLAEAQEVLDALSPECLGVLAELGCDDLEEVQGDIDYIRGEGSAEKLLAQCLENLGDPDTESLWREYVDAVAGVA